MNIMQMMKQAQELQTKMQQMQAELDALEVEGQAAAGAVVVRLVRHRRSARPQGRSSTPEAR